MALLSGLLFIAALVTALAALLLVGLVRDWLACILAILLFVAGLMGLMGTCGALAANSRLRRRDGLPLFWLVDRFLVIDDGLPWALELLPLCDCFPNDLLSDLLLALALLVVVMAFSELDFFTLVDVVLPGSVLVAVVTDFCFVVALVDGSVVGLGDAKLSRDMSVVMMRWLARFIAGDDVLDESDDDMTFLAGQVRGRLGGRGCWTFTTGGGAAAAGRLSLD